MAKAFARRLLGITVATLLAVIPVALFPIHGDAATLTWNGNSGVDLNWSTPGNWVGGVAPVNGDSLVFPAGGAVNHLSNDDMAGLSVSVVDINDAAYSITGSTPLRIANSLNLNAAGTAVFAPPIVFSTLTLSAVSGSRLDILSSMTGGAGTVNFSGTGTISLAADSSYTTAANLIGAVTVMTSTAVPFGTAVVALTPNATWEITSASTIANHIQLDSPVTIQADAFGATLSGQIDMFSGSPEFRALPGARLDLTGVMTGAGGAAPAFGGPSGGNGVVRLFNTSNSWPGTSIVGPGSDTGVNAIAFANGSFGLSPIVVNNGASLTVSLPAANIFPNDLTLAGSGGFTGGALVIVGQTATFPRTVTIAASGATITDGVNGGAFSGPLTGSGTLDFTGLGPITINAAVANTDTGTVTVANNGGVAMADAGGVAFGATTVNISNTILTWGLSGQLPAGATVNVQGAGIVALNAHSQVLARLNFDGNAGRTTDGNLTVTGSLTTTNTTSIPVTIGSTVGGGTLNLAGGPVTVNAGGASTDLSLNSIVSGAFLLNGTGITVGAAPSPGANVTLASGTLYLNASYGQVSGAAGSTIGGTGGANVLQTSGILAPGFPSSSTGSLSAGTLTLNSGATADLQINGPTAGTQYDRVTVTTGTTLSSPTLSPHLGYTPTVGDSYTIIGSPAETGTFSGYPQGAGFVLSNGTNNYAFSITYTGGAGHDVVIASVAPLTSTTSLTASQTSAAPGQSVTLTATLTSGAVSGTPSGTIQFFNGSTLVGSAPVAALGGGGLGAVLSVTLSTVGTQSLTARYVPDTVSANAFAPSASGVLGISVVAAVPVPAAGTASGLGSALERGLLLILLGGGGVAIARLRRRIAR